MGRATAAVTNCSVRDMQQLAALLWLHFDDVTVLILPVLSLFYQMLELYTFELCRIPLGKGCSVSLFFFFPLCNLSMNQLWQYSLCLCEDTGTRNMLISLEYECEFCAVALLSFFTPSKEH